MAILLMSLYGKIHFLLGYFYTIFLQCVERLYMLKGAMSYPFYLHFLEFFPGFVDRNCLEECLD